VTRTDPFEKGKPSKPPHGKIHGKGGGGSKDSKDPFDTQSNREPLGPKASPFR
jgi:hypothetical protein